MSAVFSMYDVDGNGWVDLAEMTLIVASIFKVVGDTAGAGAGAGASPEQRAADIFRIMDVNNDGRVTRAEFVRTCLNDQKLLNLLTPNTE